jgi:hypothetical protein
LRSGLTNRRTQHFDLNDAPCLDRNQ